MPTVEWRIQCDHCGHEEFEDCGTDLPLMEDHIGTCEHCGEEVCKKCNGTGDNEDLTIHATCKKEIASAEAEDE